MKKLLSTLAACLTGCLAAADFPIGIFMAEPLGPETFKAIQDAGINYVQTYATGSTKPKALERTQKYLDLAQKHNLKVMFTLKSERHLKAGKPEHVTLLVNRFKKHPAVGLWYLADEPDGQRIEKELHQIYLDVKKADPTRQISLTTCQNNYWKYYQDCLDVHMVDGYPVFHQPFPLSKLTRITGALEQAIALGKPAMPIIQCFNWKAYAQQGHIKTLPREQFDKLHYPSFTELRYQIFASLAQGVPGIWFYSFYDNNRVWEKPGNRLNTMKEFKDIFIPAVRELKDFTTLVGDVKPDLYTWARDSHVYMASWKVGAKTYLVAASAWPVEAEIERGLEGHIKGDYTLKPWGRTDRNDASVVHKGKLTASPNFKPWEVRIWELTPVTK